eukprot:GFUD01000768.1.p1 GENE.GFUD01000768.1~~GFUD01000768.1.p1  ORF type:complete len:343 (-),score=140.41 GFUD01000768.1:115-1143(-)
MTQSDPSPPPSKPSLGKVRIEVTPPKSGTCPAHNWVYLVLGVTGVMYAVYLADKETFTKVVTGMHMGGVSTAFKFVDDYSPFNEFLETDEELIEKLKKKSEEAKDDEVKAEPSKMEEVLSTARLAKFDGSEGSPGLYLAMLGVVYDVSKGKEYYGPGGGYSFFAGKDASRAFVSGQFDEEGLVSDVSGLTSADYMGLEEWASFYEKDYVRVGLVEGAFYESNGEVTQHWKDLQGWMEEARVERDKQDVEKQMFPPCNVEWTQAEGSRYWCTKKSGGVARDWVGVPRQLYYPARQPRCACVRDKGPPSTDPGARSNIGDLDSPHLKEYEGCHIKAWECRVKED